MMVTRRRGKLSGRLSAFVGAVVLSLLALACAPTTSGGGVPPAPTTPPTTTLPWSTPTGLVYPLDLRCTVNVYGSYYDYDPGDFSVQIDAPANVTEGDTFYIWVTPGEWQVPASINTTQVGLITVFNVNSLAIRFPVPANSVYVDANLTAGNNIGPGVTSVYLDATNNIVYRVPGPFIAGSTVQLPRVRVTLQAGPAYFNIQTALTNMNFASLLEGGNFGSACWEAPGSPEYFTFTQILPASP